MYIKVKIKNKLIFTVLDHFIKEEKKGSIEVISFNIEIDSLRSFIAKRKDDYSYIFICLDEDYVDLMEGIDLSELFPNTPIYMNFTDESIEQTFLIATTKTKKSLY